MAKSNKNKQNNARAVRAEARASKNNEGNNASPHVQTEDSTSILVCGSITASETESEQEKEFACYEYLKKDKEQQ